MFYECPKCKKIHDTNEWNESTIKYYGEEITKIDECKNRYCFVCPSCNKISIRNKITEIKNKKDIVKSNLLKLAN